MFDNLEIRKAFVIVDNITGNEVEVCTFNCTLNIKSGIYQTMNITYPNLYNIHKDAILEKYREFETEVSSLAITMGLASKVKGFSTLEELGEVKQDIKEMVADIMKDVIASLGNVEVNPVPTMDVGVDQFKQYR